MNRLFARLAPAGPPNQGAGRGAPSASVGRVVTALLFTLLLGVAVGGGAIGFLSFARQKARPAPETAPWSLLAAGVLAVIANGVIAAAIRQRKGAGRPFLSLYTDHLKRSAWLLALPAVAALQPPLEATRDELALALCAFAGALAAYSAYQWADDDETPSRGLVRWVPPAVVGVAMVAYGVMISIIAIDNHHSFNTGRADLGYYLSIFRQSSQGIPLGCSVCGGGTHLTGHLDPILVLLSPIFLIYPFAETILLLQTVWLASGAVPVYLLAQNHLKHRGAAAAIAVAYLAYPALHGINLFDFHSIALCVPLFVWLLYFLEKERTWPYYVILGLLLLVREDIAIALCFVGLYAIFSGDRQRVRRGWTTIVFAVLYFVTAKTTLMGRADPLNAAPGAAGGYAYYYEALIPPGKSTAALIGTLLTDPVYVLVHVFTDDKIDFVLKLLVPLAFVPLFARGRMMLTYGCVLTLLASRPFLYSIHFQYSSLLVPFLFVLTATGLGRLRSGEIRLPRVSGIRLARALSAGILVSTLLCSWKFGGVVPNSSFQAGFRPLGRNPTPDKVELAAWLRDVARSLPRGAKIAGNSRLITHLGAVTSIHLFEDRRSADYVIANTAARPFGPEILAEAARGELTFMTGHGGINLYKTRYANKTRPARARKDDGREPKEDAEE